MNKALSRPYALGQKFAPKDVIFTVVPASIPSGAIPIYDQDCESCVIGYRRDQGGMWWVYDLDGKVIEFGEQGLETPLFDPIDLIFLVGGLFRAVTRTTLKKGALLARAGSKITTASISKGTAELLRAGARSLLSVNKLKFTATTIRHMTEKGRHVPLQILHLAIKHGKRIADPKGVKGAFQYTIPMFRNGTQYMLEVVVREADWTILHFMYK